MIKLSNITKIYKADGVETNALKGINLTIDSGEMLAIVGTSGSGKTTLLNIIGAMDSASSGQYTFNEIRVTELNKNKFREFRKDNISFVFQHFELMTMYDVYANVEMPLIARDVSKRERKKIILQCLEKLQIADLASKFPNHLSGGQQQRVAIARALAADTKVLLADEPTGALDNNTSSTLMKVFNEIRDLGKTIIIVTHDLNIANQCERIIKIDDGIITESI